MRIERLISSAMATAIIISLLSFSTSADLSKKPGEIGFEIGQNKQDSDEFDFLDKPYSLTSGDYYMGIGIETGAWTHRNAIGSADDSGKKIMNINHEFIYGINAYCPWANLYRSGYVLIDRDENGVALKTSHSAYGPAGIYYDEDEGENGIKEYSQLHDAKITGSGTYTVGIQGYNFKADVANNTNEYGNGINTLCITSNIKFAEKNKITIKNPVLKLYNSKEAYESKKPDKQISADYWLPSVEHIEETTSYMEYGFVNVYTAIDSRKDKEHYNHKGGLDVFGLSGYTGAESDKYKTGYEGCQYLPEYALEITFDVNMPSEYTATKQTSSSEKNIQTTKAPISTVTFTTKTTPTLETKKAKIIKLTSSKKKTLKVTWKKVSGAKGYEIKLATNKKFTKNKRTVKVKKSATNKIIKKLKSNKRYYVKIRAYTNVKVNGYTVTANGPWSDIKRSKMIK